MKLGELLTVLGRTSDLPAEASAKEVTGIVYDSRKVVHGSLFVAVRGFHSDGHQFISQAVGRGAAAVVCEQEGVRRAAGGATVIVVENSRRALAILADEYYRHPSRRLRLFGVTGTNGKTTTAYLAKSIIEAGGGKAGLIGTIDYRVGDRTYPAPNTTPESADLQHLLAEMAEIGDDACVMEVSSHALTLGRTLGCSFAAAAFTNLTQDHLDFHGTMESYFSAKLLLFEGLSPDAAAVVNIDDARGTDIIAATRARVITTGSSPRAVVRPAGPISHGIHGLAFDAATPSGVIPLESPLIGRHNVANILTAVGLGLAAGIGNEEIGRGIRSMHTVPGRMEKVVAGQPFGVIVDYAHTEDALGRLLEAVREITPGRVITIFGCGGDRDRTKRPRMGAAALKGSDVAIVTSDNPRTEDPGAIIGEIESGMAAGVKIGGPEVLKALPAGPGEWTALGKTPYLVIHDRRAAIAAAVGMAKPGDAVVLAGKGHEDYQIIGDRKIRFDDREVAREEIGKCG